MGRHRGAASFPLRRGSACAVRVVFRFRLELTRTKERAKRRVRTFAGPAFCIAARMHFRPQLQVPAKAGKKHKSGEPISFSEENHFAIFHKKQVSKYRENYCNFKNFVININFVDFILVSFLTTC